MVNYTPKLRDKNDQYNIKVEEIMSRSSVTFKPEMKIQEAINILVKNSLTGAPVINESKKVVGFLSEKDCLILATAQRYYNSPPREGKDYMTTSLICVHENDTVLSAIDAFEKHPIHGYTDESDVSFGNRSQ